ncbi:MAG: vitamin K epoxide reductase family protein [Anaerolineales bacterium]|jgi:uncharacterized membrane protein
MKRIAITALLLISFVLPTATATAQADVVRAVLFYSPTCPHCQQVISVNMPQISQQFNSSGVWSYYGENYDPDSEQAPALVALQGNALQVLYVDTTSEIGNELYAAAIDRYSIPQEDWVVPLMVVGETILTGSIDIPAQLPLITEEALGSGGIDWPDIPGLTGYIEALQPFPDQPAAQVEATPSAESTAAASVPTAQPEAPPEVLDRNPADLPLGERIMLDPGGNTLSIVVIIAMLFSLVAVGLRWNGRFAPRRPEPLTFWVPILAFAGIAVAGYLAYIAATGNKATCGPVGDCNTVAQSEYSTVLLGIPNAYLGVFGYVLILAGWLIARYAPPATARIATLGVFAAGVFGTLFALYLTFLEPFVIGASCAWCLASAVIITAITLLSAGPASFAYNRKGTSQQ